MFDESFTAHYVERSGDCGPTDDEQVRIDLQPPQRVRMRRSHDRIIPDMQ
jgi:hypothetical protein